jgi:imidazolonepropionase-like amidohydrolase
VDLEDSWVDTAGWHIEPSVTAELLPGRFALPGLIDAHSHLSFNMGLDGPVPVDLAGAEANRRRIARDGVVMVRDAGGAPDVVLALLSRAGTPTVVAAGRHLAPPGYYFEAVHLPALPDDLIDTALRDLAQGAQWVKLVADFPPSRARSMSVGRPAERTYDLDLVQALIAAVHNAGARVAAHVTTPLVADLVPMGLDSVEHGTAMDEDTLIDMSRRGTAWTPTLCAALPSGDRETTAERREMFRQLLPAAVRLGVPVLTGSDVVGSIPREVAMLAELGLDPCDALAAATTAPRRFLEPDQPHAAASVVTYHHDPRNDPAILATPAAVVIAGVRVH